MHTNSYIVLSCGNIETCTARGVLKHRKNNIVVGDFVEFDNTKAITYVEPRKNLFLRPSVANVNCLNIVVSAIPEPDFLMIDTLISTGVFKGTKVYITVNKSELSENVSDYVAKNYSKAVDGIFIVSAEKREGLQSLTDAIKGQLCAFCGQSAVGKTSVINAAFGLNRKVGNVSEKILRGKNTTTHSEIIFNNGCLLIDTPGFSSIDCQIPSNQLKDTYIEFKELSSDCYFSDCKHINEPDCVVKEALESGLISKDRYERYLEIYKKIVEDEKHAKY